MKTNDMTGTAKCDDCGMAAEHERGPGTPLSIKHKKWCHEATWQVRLDPAFAVMLQRDFVTRKYEPVVRVLSFIEDCTWERLGEASVPRMIRELRLTESTTRRAVRWLLDAGFIERVRSIRRGTRYAYLAVRKDA